MPSGAVGVGIGSGFDGDLGGAEQRAPEIDTVADLGLVADAVARRGVSVDDVEAIMSRNWLRVLPKDAAGS